jgi:hypothetical protein
MADKPNEERKPLHGAVLKIERRAFEQMLDLPVDVNVVGVFIDAPTASLILHLVGDALPEIPVGGVARRATLLLRHKRDDEGDWYQRVEFTVEAR